MLLVFSCRIVELNLGLEAPPSTGTNTDPNQLIARLGRTIALLATNPEARQAFLNGQNSSADSTAPPIHTVRLLVLLCFLSSPRLTPVYYRKGLI